MINDPNNQVHRAAVDAMLRVVETASKESLLSYVNVVFTDLIGMLLREGAGQVYEAYVAKVGHAVVGQYLVNAAGFAVPKLKAHILSLLDQGF